MFLKAALGLRPPFTSVPNVFFSSRAPEIARQSNVFGTGTQTKFFARGPTWTTIPKRSFHFKARLQQPQGFNRQQYQRFNRGGGRIPIVNLMHNWSQRPTFVYEIGGVGLLVGGLYTWNLEKVPVSGRRRFNVVGDGTMEDLGKQQSEEILRQYGPQLIPDWEPRSQMVSRVMKRLLPHSGLPDKGWEVHVIESEEANAFVLPGGKVFVFSGILPICKDENGVAAVLGHEIAHNVARHMNEKVSQSFILGAVALFLQQLVGLPDVASNLLLTLAFERPGSRAQESEADYIGLMMMAQSCYPPEAAANLWAEMEKTQKDQPQPPQMLSTHPSHHNRQEKIREWLPEAQMKYEQSECYGTGQYLSQFKDRVVGVYT